MKKIKISQNGVKNALEEFKIEKDKISQSISEYVWNSYDANANEIEINFIKDTLERIIEVKIIDNGDGISYEELDEKFGYLLQSQKKSISQERRIDSNLHGQKGIGRLTFDYFAKNATWKTSYYDNSEKCYEYEINIDSKSIEGYKTTDLKSIEKKYGTIVTLKVKDEIIINFEKVIDYIKKQFCWLLELKENLNIYININGVREKLEYNDLIYNTKKVTKVIENSKFDIKLITWKEKTGKENSKYYFIDSNFIEKFKCLTKFNKKGDNFRHSLYIKSEYFDDLVFSDFESIPADRTLYISNCVNDEKFKFLIKFLEEFLKTERKEFLKHYAKKNVIERYEKKNILPKFPTNAIGAYRKKLLIDSIEEIYVMEPTLFNNLNNIQSKTFVRFLDLILNQEDNTALFKILEDVINLKEEERQELSNILDKTKLSNIINTIKLIEDRKKAVEYLKELVYNNELKTKEVPHIQNFIEGHFWIFGEQFSLIAAAEDKFKKALMKFWLEIKGEKLEEKIASKDVDYKYKNREMDIFLCKQDKLHDKVHNVVVELKRPNIKLGSKEFRQVEDYLEQIQKTSMFNASNYEWTFILVGNEFSNDNHINNQFKSASNHGEKFLAKKFDNYKIYVKKWSEIFNEFDIKYKFLLDKLNLEKELIADIYRSADEIVEEALNNNTSVINF